MAIYTIGGIKGGSGKTTVATNLTVLLAADGRDVLLVDADDQETASDFTVWRNNEHRRPSGLYGDPAHRRCRPHRDPASGVQVR